NENVAPASQAWWESYRERLERVAQQASRNGGDGAAGDGEAVRRPETAVDQGGGCRLQRETPAHPNGNRGRATGRPRRGTQTVARARELLDAAGSVHARAQAEVDRARALHDGSAGQP